MDIFGEQHRLERMLKEKDAEIERLQSCLYAQESVPALYEKIKQKDAEIERLRGFVRVLAGIPIEAFDRHDERPDDFPLMTWNDYQLTVGHIREARRALEQK